MLLPSVDAQHHQQNSFSFQVHLRHKHAWSLIITSLLNDTFLPLNFIRQYNSVAITQPYVKPQEKKIEDLASGYFLQQLAFVELGRNS